MSEAERSFKVRLAKSGKEFDIGPDDTIAEVLIDAGVPLKVSCEQGICGTCLTPVLEGTPDHRDMFLNDEEHAANDWMTLCCSRSRTDVIVIDL